MNTMPRGFTFIELLLVIYLIGVLAAIAMPAYREYLLRSQVAEGLGMAQTVKEAVQRYYAHRGELPPHNQAAGLPEAGKLLGKYVRSIVVTEGAIHISYRNSPPIDDKVLSLHPAINKQTGQLARWVCGTQRIDTQRWQVVGADATSLPSATLPSTCK